MATNPVDPYAQIYRSVQRREQTQQRAFSGSSLEQAMQDERDNQIRLGIIAAPPPDAVAKATKIARDTDVAPGEVDGNLASAEKMQQANRMTAVLGKYPAFTRFAQTNPRAVAAAADDHKALGILGDAWDYLNSMGNAVDATWRVQGSKVNAGLADFVGEAYDTLTSIAQPGRETVGQAEARKAARTTYWRGGVNTAENARKAAMPKTDSYVLGQVNEGIANLGPSLFATIAGVVAKSPQLTMALMGAQTGIPAYTDARYANKGVVDSARYGFVQGLIEVATEKIPAMSLVDDIMKRTPIGKTIIRQLGQEIPGEQVATILQDFSTWATLNPEKPFSAYVAERPQAALDTLIQTAVGTTAQTSLTVAVDRTVQSVAKVAGRVVQAREAKHEAEFFNRVERAAAESNHLGRDPETYAEFMEFVANDKGVGQVFIPAEAIRAYQQSDSYDQFDDPFADYQAQIDEAFEVGGDVVLPAGFALGTLPGTPAWAAVKADMRLAPGGMSAREADDLSSQLDDIMGELTDQAYQRDADQQGERDARGLIVERVSAMLQNAGFTPANARVQAELIAQKEAVRATRMGRELTGAEFGTEVVSVLPPALAEIQKADGLDLVVNALRKGKPATVQRGKSLLEWIAARGGVEDVGGDIASMGADRWHMLDKPVKGVIGKGKKKGQAFTATVIPGRRKLIKPSNAAQGSIIGGEFNPNTLENTLDAAINEGFFPELLGQRELGTEYADLIDTGILLAAIGDELAGRSLYAEEAITDNVRAAAAELEQMLAERGLVASELTDAEIRAAVGQMEQEGSGGVIYDQLPESIDIDGVARPTRNSEGMPLAGSEEGLRAFWKWFGDSKVVDEEGRPLVVYHGTTNADTIKDVGFKSGWTHLTDAKEVADSYQQWDRGASPDTLAVYAKAENPSYYDAAGQKYTEIGNKVFRATSDAERSGYDAIIIKAIRDNYDSSVPTAPHTTIVAFSPTQIKSINNRGSFDPADARILYQEFNEGPRGRILMDGARPFRIELFQARNLSTLLHELSHQWLEELRADATTKETPVASYRRVARLVQASAPKVQNGFVRLWRGERVGDSGKGLNYTNDLAGIALPFREGYGGELVYIDVPAEDAASYEMTGAVAPGAEFHVPAGIAAKARAVPVPIDPQSQVKADWQAVTEWFAANGNPIVDGVIPVEAHEMWARGGERYLMEGKAPSPALTGPFATFRGWMWSIYKTVQALRAPITPEIREVFDRLLATDEEIAAMAEMQALQPMFKDAAAIGITGQEFEAYKAQAQAARDEANSTLLAKTMAAIRRRETKKFRDERKAVMADEAERLNDEPLLKSIRLMQATPIDQEWLVDRMGLDVLSLLPKRVPPLWRERGVNPDSLAELAGFGSGQQMIEVLIGAERQHRQAREGGDQRTMRARMIENAADAEMTLRYGDDPLNDGSIEQEAIAAVNGELQGELLASEVRLLSRRTGQRPTPYKIARQWARNRVRTGLVSVEASPGAIQRHARNVAKAGRDAEKAMLAGKMDEALRFKQQQMLSSALLAEAKEASDEVSAAVKRLSSVSRNRKRDSIDPDYWDQAQAVLAGYDFAPRTEKLMREREGFEKWAAARIAEGEEIQIPERMVAPGTNYTRMTVEQVMGIDDTIKSILHLGRRKKELQLGKERRDWHEARGEWLNGAEALPERPIGPDRNASPSKVRGLISNLIRIDMMAKVMDGGDPNGLMTRIFANGAKAADNTYARLQKTVLEPIADAYMAMKGSRLFDRISAPEWIDYRTGRPQVFMRSDLLAIAANLGNESSLHKMLAGEALLFKGQEELAPTLEGVTAMLNRELNEAEWQMVITGWRRVEMMGEEAFATERELTGVKPEKIEPRMVETPLGTVEGGYWPAVYDTDAVRAADAGVNLDAFKGDDFDALIGKNGIGTNKGYTISRTDFVAPMLLNYEAVLFGHVNQVAKRVAYQAWAKNALKVIRDRRVKAMWARKLGQEYHAQLEPWLRDTINQGQIAGMGHLSAVDNILRKARMNMTAMGLVFRATTLIAQVGGLPNSMKAIGAANVAKGFRLYAQDGGAMIARIMDASPLMARRLNEFDRDQAAALAAMQNPPTTEIGRKLKPVADARDKFNAAGFHLIGAIQLYTVDLPTWAGAYDKAMRSNEDGGLDLDHDAAVDYADRMVEEAQGAGRAAQLAAIQRAGEMSRIVTLFYTFFGTVMNYQWEMTQDIRGGKYRKAAVSAGWIMVVAPLIGALIGDAVRGNLPDDDDDDSWLAWVMRKVFFGMFSGVPIVRDVANQAERKAAGEYAPDPATPWQRIAGAVGGAGKDAFAAISQTDSYQLLQNNADFLPEPADVSDKWLKHGIEAVGFATGTGLGQVATTSQFAKEMGDGDADPDGAAQIAQGLITGKLKD